MAGCGVDEVFGRLAGVDHEAILYTTVSRKNPCSILPGPAQTYGEFHALRSRGSQLSTDNDLTTFGSAFHDEPQDSVAGSSDRQAIQ